MTSLPTTTNPGDRIRLDSAASILGAMRLDPADHLPRLAEFLNEYADQHAGAEFTLAYLGRVARYEQLIHDVFGPDPQPTDFPGLDPDGNPYVCCYCGAERQAHHLRPVTINGQHEGQYVCRDCAGDLEDKAHE